MSDIHPLKVTRWIDYDPFFIPVGHPPNHVTRVWTSTQVLDVQKGNSAKSPSPSIEDHQRRAAQSSASPVWTFTKIMVAAFMIAMWHLSVQITIPSFWICLRYNAITVSLLSV